VNRHYQAYCRPRGSKGPWQKMAGVEADDFAECYTKAMRAGELTNNPTLGQQEYDIRPEAPAPPAGTYATRELRPNLPP
jgi:hypothetical protein